MCMFSAPEIKTATVKKVAPPPMRSDKEIAVSAREKRRRSLARKGRSSTLVTDGEGAPGSANVGTKTLLGA